MTKESKSPILLERYNKDTTLIDTHILTRCKSYYDISAPLFVGFELTTNCNLRCGHCRAAENTSKKRSIELDTSKVKSIIDQLAEQQVYTVGITGGEPFLRHDIIEIVAYCKLKALQLIIYTNATLISQNIALSLANLLDKYDIVHVSIDSPIPEIHNKMRGKECYNQSLSGLKFLTDAGVSVRLNAVPTTLNKDSLIGIADLAEKYNVKFLSGSPLMTIGRGNDSSLVPDPAEMYELEKQLYERLKDSNVEFEGGISGAICCLKEACVSIDSKLLNRPGSDKRICDAGTRKLFIDAGGNAFPCSLFAMHDRFCIGNILSTPLNELWKSDKLTLFKQGVAKDEKICGDCELWPICNGGCMALSMEHFSSLDTPDPRCITVQQHYQQNGR